MLAAKFVAKLTAIASNNLVKFASKQKANICEVYVKNNSKKASKIDNSNNLNNKQFLKVKLKKSKTKSIKKCENRQTI